MQTLGNLRGILLSEKASQKHTRDIIPLRGHVRNDGSTDMENRLVGFRKEERGGGVSEYKRVHEGPPVLELSVF